MEAELEFGRQTEQKTFFLPEKKEFGSRKVKQLSMFRTGFGVI